MKNMSNRERKKLIADDLVQLIVNFEPANEMSKLNESIIALSETVNFLRNEMKDNTAQITHLSTLNENLSETINNMSAQIKDNSTKIVQLSVKTAQLNDKTVQLNDLCISLTADAERVDQYLRVNNVEIVGLATSTKEISDEDNALNFFKEVLEVPISPDEIDICHEVPSKRRDRKNVVICKFISRKSKVSVLLAKSKLREYNERNEDSTILLYEHLSPSNRELYIKAAKLKYDLKFKYFWTKNGFPFLRKAEGTTVFKIKSIEDLALVP